jgi:hypothetical protein
MVERAADPEYALMYYNHCNEADMIQWRHDMDQLAADNADLKAKLAAMDQQVAQLQGTPVDPAYVPQDAQDVALSPDVVDQSAPGGAQDSRTNLALGGTATQSSTGTFDSGGPAVASRAIDGNTDGNFFDHSVTHTGQEQAWWQVDLGNTYNLANIVIWNRTDAAMERLSNFYVSVLDDQGNAVWTGNFCTNGEYPNPGLSINLPANISGRFVKIGLNGVNFLHLAEVQVY